MLENLETYRESYDPLLEEEKENSNQKRKSKSLFSKSIIENYGKGIAFFSSCKKKIYSTVKKMSNDFSNAGKHAAKNIEKAQTNLDVSEIISHMTNPLLNKISRNSSGIDAQDNQEKREEETLVDNYERLTISDSEEREKERLERPKIGKQIKRKYDKIKKTNLKINIPDIKELSIDMLTTERILTIVQNDEEKKDPLAETSIHNIMVKQNMEKEEIEIEKNQNLMEKNTNLEKSIQNIEVKQNIEYEEIEKNQNLMEKDTNLEKSIQNIEVKQKIEKEEIEIEKNQNLMEKDTNLEKSIQNIEVKQNIKKEEIEIEKNQNLMVNDASLEKLIQNIEVKQNIEKEEIEIEKNQNLMVNDASLEKLIQNIEVKQNKEKEEIEIEKNQNLMEKDSNLKKSFQNMEVKLNMDKEESKSEKQQSLKNDKDIEDPLSFHQSLIADMTIISNESEKPNAAFRSCVSESKPSKPNFNHYLDQEFPFDILKKNPVEIIKNQKIEDIKAKNKKKSRFLAWCCN